MGHTTTAQLEPRLVSITAAANSLGLGRSNFYRLIHAGQIRTVRVGGRHLVPVDALDEFVAGLTGDVA